MYLIQQLTANPIQTQTLILQDGTSLNMTIQFVPMQFGWVITSLVYSPKSFTLQGLRITNNPNMLYPFKNLIPFGLACFSTNNREPSQAQDFSSGASNLYILTAAEVAQYTELLQDG